MEWTVRATIKPTVKPGGEKRFNEEAKHEKSYVPDEVGLGWVVG